MKNVFLLVLILGFISCNDSSVKIQLMQKQIDSLQTVITESYKPGFGELMTGIQNHHSKLWFAGKYKNWKLAEFEINELKEIIEDILKYQKGREESQLIEMVDPALNDIEQAVKKEDLELFKSSYNGLTKSCNDCHHLTKFEFNVVKVPDISPYTSQEFNIEK